MTQLQGNIFCETNQLTGRFSLTNPEFLLLLCLQTEGRCRHGMFFSQGIRRYRRTNALLCEGDKTHLDIFSFPDEYLLAFLFFFAQLIIYLNNILSLYISRRHAPSSEFFFFALLLIFFGVVFHIISVAIMEVLTYPVCTTTCM